MSIQLKLSNVLSAKQCCVLAFWACKAGAVGGVSQLGLRPDVGSGKFSQKFDLVVGSAPSDGNFYSLELGRRLRHDASRRWDALPIVPPLEALASELAESDHASRELRRAKEFGELPKIYTDHPAVLAAPADVEVHPICLYLDGVGYSRLDSCLGIWCYFLLTGRRHLCAVLRRCELCSCGCKGWCSLSPVFTCLAWSLSSMLRGCHPSSRHDGSPWRPSDEERASKAGAPLQWRAVCVLLKGDWYEYAHSLGFPSWADGVAPCPLCFATPDNFFSATGLSVFSPGHARKELDHYLRACERCEVQVELDRPKQVQVRAALLYDKRKQGAHGRAVQVDIPELGLAKHDRVEPAPSMLDIASLDDAATPCLATFWRTQQETLTRHRNPLFSAATGMSPQSLGLDWMHVLSLGVFRVLLMNLVWFGMCLSSLQ